MGGERAKWVEHGGDSFAFGSVNGRGPCDPGERRAGWRDTEARQKRKSKCGSDFCGVIHAIIQSVSKLYQQKPNKIRRQINSPNQKSKKGMHPPRETTPWAGSLARIVTNVVNMKQSGPTRKQRKKLKKQNHRICGSHSFQCTGGPSDVPLMPCTSDGWRSGQAASIPIPPISTFEPHHLFSHLLWSLPVRPEMKARGTSYL